jgi:hypothetical protein
MLSSLCPNPQEGEEEGEKKARQVTMAFDSSVV